MLFLKTFKPKIKKILSLKSISLVLVLVIISIFFPSPSLAISNPLTWGINLIVGAISTPFVLLITAVFAVLLFLSYAFAWLTGALLTWVTSPDFFSWQYTQNPAVEAGLNITKNFVNMGLVVALIVIALATALRIKEYASQKTLIRLIAVALLVNFAPVIVGLIVDASNLVMNYFLTKIQIGISNLINSLLKQEPEAYINDLLQITVGTFTGKISVLAEGAILTSLYLFIGFAFLFFFFIFFLRYIAIWLLTILAPLAFVAWILPATKKFWDQWWEQLIQWSIIGIPMAFFLYLAMSIFAELSVVFKSKLSLLGVLGLGKDIAGLVDKIFPYYLVLAILYLGFIIGLKTSAMGASGIIDFAKTKGKAGAKWAAKRIPEGTMAATAGAFRGLGKGIKEGKGLGRITGAATGAFKGAATYEGREKGREVMGRMLEKAHLVRPGAYETARRKRWKIEEETKKLDTLPTDRLHEIAQRKILRPADKRGAIAASEVLAKRGALGGGKNEEKEKSLLPMMQSFGADTKQALKARPDWGSLIGKTTEDTKKQIEGTTRKDFTNHTQAEALKNEGVVIHLDSSKVQDIRSRGSTEQRNALNNTINEMKTYGPACERLLVQARKIQQEADQLRQERKPGWEKEFGKKTKEWHIIVDGLKKFKQDPDFN